MRLPLIAELDSRDGVSNRDERLTNVLQENDEGAVFAALRPGLSLDAQASGVGNGLVVFNNELVSVHGATLYVGFLENPENLNEFVDVIGLGTYINYFGRLGLTYYGAAFNDGFPAILNTSADGITFTDVVTTSLKKVIRIRGLEDEDWIAVVGVLVSGYTAISLYQFDLTLVDETSFNNWPEIYDVASGNGIIVAVGRTITGGESGVYQAGTGTWSRTINTAIRAFDLVHFGNGIFMATADLTSTIPTIVKSADGVTWTICPPPATADASTINYLLFAEGVFVALYSKTTYKAIYTSADGITWTNKQTIFPSDTRYIRGFTFAAGTYFADIDGTLFSSTNLVDWTDGGALPYRVDGEVGYSVQEFIGLGNTLFVNGSSDDVDENTTYSTHSKNLQLTLPTPISTTLNSSRYDFCQSPL